MQDFTTPNQNIPNKKIRTKKSAIVRRFNESPKQSTHPNRHCENPHPESPLQESSILSKN
ncbi:hypothetical protein [Helicobacter sp. T3_23-1056]